MRFSVAVQVLAALVVLSGTSGGDIPELISYQGKVTDNAGSPVADGIYTMRFQIYDQLVGGLPLWDSGAQGVDLANGVFSIMLGGAGQPTLNLPFDDDYWLQVSFQGDLQTPRRRLGSVGYSFMASGLVPGTVMSGAISDLPWATLKATNSGTTGDVVGLWGESACPGGGGVFGNGTASTGDTYGVFGLTASTNGMGVYGWATANDGDTYGVHGLSDSESGTGVYGLASATTGANCGVHGRSTSTDGTGVVGEALATTGTTYGGVFASLSPSGTAVYGYAWAAAGETYGGKFVSASTSGRALYGYATAATGTTYGVQGESASTSGRAVAGYATATTGATYGVFGHSTSTSGMGVYGEALATTGTTYGVEGENASTSGRAVYGYAFATTGSNYGGRFVSTSTSGTGVYGNGWATTGTNYGVYGITNSPSGYGGYFSGDVHVAGSLSKASGSFLIDHPLDPENKLLRHNFVESPENLLIYRGRARLDERGEVVINMPEYFGALAEEADATVNLTPVGKWMMSDAWPFGYEWSPERDSFTAYGQPGSEVAWLVMAERDDPVIRRLARPVEEEKGPENKFCDRGKLLHPTAYGYPESMGRDYQRDEEQRLRMGDERR